MDLDHLNGLCIGISRDTEEKKKKVVVHFDINGTITAVDNTEPGTAEQNANMLLARTTQGVVIDGVWRVGGGGATISYYEWLKCAHPSEYKKVSFTFTHPGQPGEHLRDMIPRVAAMCHGPTKGSDGGEAKLLLFDSFYRLIEAYPDAIIVLRTFGRDTEEVLATLKNHPRVPQIVRLNAVRDTDYNQIYLSSTPQTLICVQEDYDWWHEHGRDKTHGKQLRGHEDLIQLFFDDNDCVNHDGQHPETTHFFLVNTIEALTNPNYFIDLAATKIKI